MANQLLTGSINLSKLIEQAKKGHSAFSKSEKNGNIYVNVNIWLNEERDQYGHDGSLQLNSKKEQREAEGKIYIGNLKKAEAATPHPFTAKEASTLPELDESSLPF